MFSEFFVQTKKIQKYKTRVASKITYYTPPARTNYGKFSIRFHGVKLIWNSPDESWKHLSRNKVNIKKSKMIGNTEKSTEIFDL